MSVLSTRRRRDVAGPRVVAALTLPGWSTPGARPRAWRATRFSQTASRSAEVRRRRFSLLVPARHEDAVLGRTPWTASRLRARRRRGALRRRPRRPGHRRRRRAGCPRHAGAGAGRRRPLGGRRTSPRRSTRRCRSAPATSSASSTPRTRCTPTCSRHRRTPSDPTGADVVQGGVQLMNIHSQLVGPAQLPGVLLLVPQPAALPRATGTSSRSAATPCSSAPTLLRAVDGWDADCLAEDCELGVRLSARWARRSAWRTSPRWSPGRRPPAR